jgi:hypothetical protein
MDTGTKEEKALVAVDDVGLVEPPDDGLVSPEWLVGKREWNRAS